MYWGDGEGLPVLHNYSVIWNFEIYGRDTMDYFLLLSKTCIKYHESCIMLFTEIWLIPDICDILVEIEGFTHINADRMRSQGEVCVRQWQVVQVVLIREYALCEKCLEMTLSVICRSKNKIELSLTVHETFCQEAVELCVSTCSHTDLRSVEILWYYIMFPLMVMHPELLPEW